MSDGNRAGGTTDVRKWQGEHIATVRRRLRLSPGVIGLCLIMVCAACFIVETPVVRAAPGPILGPDCIPCPGGGGLCEPNCGSGCNPTYVPVTIDDLRVTTKATNASISWSESPGAQTTTFYWGNSTSYSYSQSAQSWSVFLDYIEPDTVYYYEIYAHEPTGSGCGTIYTSNSRTGSFDTAFENVSGSYQYIQTDISGYVFNDTGTPAPSGLGVYLTCARPYDAYYAEWYNYGWTQTGGYFNVSTDPSNGVPFCDGEGAEYTGFTVEIENGFGVAKSTWVGYWNSTVAVWDVQYIDFALSSNIVSNPIVQIADYSNANETNGFPSSHLGYKKDVSYRDSASHCYTLFALPAGCFTTVYAGSASESYNVTGTNLVVTQRYISSGTLEFDSFNRSVVVTQVNLVGTEGSPVLQGASFQAGSAIGPSMTGAYPLYHWGGSGSGQGVMVYLNSPQKGSINVNATDYDNWTNEYPVSIDIPVGDIADAIVSALSGGFELGWEFDVDTTIATNTFSEEATASWSVGLNWTLSGNSATVPTCYAVYGIGGATSSSSTTANAVGLWGYDPTYVGGVYSCPLP
jgi:hypothetical protein